MLIRKGDFWIAMAVLLGGLVMVGASLYSLWQGLSSYGWEERPGVVLSTSIHRVRDSHSTNIYHYRPEIFYRYQMSGYSLTDDLFYPAYSSERSKEDAEAWLARFPEGAEVRVYVNPDKPKESMLMPGLHLVHLLKPLTGLAVCAMGVFLFARLRRR